MTEAFDTLTCAVPLHDGFTSLAGMPTPPGVPSGNRVSTVSGGAHCELDIEA